MTHEIKIIEHYANAVVSGDKTFEVRKNDRGYQKGDIVRFTVINGRMGMAPQILDGHYLNGKEYEITYVLAGFEGLKEGWCVFGIRPLVEK